MGRYLTRPRATGGTYGKEQRPGGSGVVSGHGGPGLRLVAGFGPLASPRVAMTGV